MLAYAIHGRRRKLKSFCRRHERLNCLSRSDRRNSEAVGRRRNLFDAADAQPCKRGEYPCEVWWRGCPDAAVGVAPSVAFGATFPRHAGEGSRLIAYVVSERRWYYWLLNEPESLATESCAATVNTIAIAAPTAAAPGKKG